MEMVDILLPPDFRATGQQKPKEQAWKDGDWIGAFNLWIIQRDPIPAIVYQIRSENKSWAPNKLDVTVGGHYFAGEKMFDGLREANEELGKTYKKEELLYLGKKINISVDTLGNSRHVIMDVFIIEDNSPLDSYTLQEEEISAICACPINELVKAHRDPSYQFSVITLTATGQKISRSINKNSFPFNWDNYHFKMALLAQRFLAGEKDLLY